MAILAVLMNALAPAISQARQVRQAGQAGSDWVELCSVGGSKWLRLDAAGQVLAQSLTRPADAPPAWHDAACGYCLAHAGSFALAAPLALALGALVVDVRQPPPRPPAHAPYAAPVWTRPALRGPPSL